MIICVSNLNQGIGEWQDNAERIKRAIRKAKTLQDPVLLLPELATVGCGAFFYAMTRMRNPIRSCRMFSRKRRGSQSSAAQS